MTEFAHDPAATSATAAFVSGLLVWLGHRLVGKAAIQTAVNAGFAELMGQMRQELRVALKERDDAREQSAAKSIKIEELQRTIAALEVRVNSAAILDAEH